MEESRPGGHRAERTVAGCLIAGIVGALATGTVYWFGGQPQLEGLFLALTFGGLGTGLVVWAHRLLPDDDVTEPWPYATGPAGAQHDEDALTEFHDDLDRDQVLERRTMLRRLLLGSIGAIGVMAVFPIRSLGPNPGRSLRVTPWRRGVRVVDSDGRVVRVDDVPVGGLVTVFPEGHLDAADAVAVLVRVPTDSPRSTGTEPPVDGIYVYSKICTHAGCPVGLYVDERRTLLCPCHQSEFDVIDGAQPVSGPAARALPRLPIAAGADGALSATGDFDRPVGPAWWTM